MDTLPSRTTHLEQARQFGVSIIGPLRQSSVWAMLEPLLFERVGSSYRRTTWGSDSLVATVYVQDGGEYILIYNETKLLEWRRTCQLRVAY